MLRCDRFLGRGRDAAILSCSSSWRGSVLGQYESTGSDAFSGIFTPASFWRILIGRQDRGRGLCVFGSPRSRERSVLGRVGRSAATITTCPSPTGAPFSAISAAI